MSASNIFVFRKIRSKSIHAIIISTIILSAILVVLIVFSSDYINYTIGVLKGPSFIPQNEIQNFPNAIAIHDKYIRVKVDDIYTTNGSFEVKK